MSGLAGYDMERLRRALVARYGPDLGEEAHADAVAYAVADWQRISAMDNPVGYLYRVGQSRLRRHLRRLPVRFELPAARHVQPGEWVEPGLPAALAALSEQQRACLLLVVGDQWSYSEVAALLDITKASVQTHVTRAKQSIREQLGVTHG
jgi:DNA-directed RNA polymerase specialized sigma24 family protein